MKLQVISPLLEEASIAPQAVASSSHIALTNRRKHPLKQETHDNSNNMDYSTQGNATTTKKARTTSTEHKQVKRK